MSILEKFDFASHSFESSYNKHICICIFQIWSKTSKKQIEEAIEKVYAERVSEILIDNNGKIFTEVTPMDQLIYGESVNGDYFSFGAVVADPANVDASRLCEFADELELESVFVMLHSYNDLDALKIYLGE